jgi:hypothetical protein
MPQQVLVDIEQSHYHGGKLEKGDYDMGHKGMTLGDFMETREIRESNLSKPELVAIRLYTTSSYPRINGPLRDLEVKKHPWAMIVYFISEGLKKLRAVRAAQDPEGFMKTVVLWRGLQNMQIDEEMFQKFGGTELAPMSTTANIEVAQNYSKSACPLLLKYTTTAMETGVAIDFLSVYPKEREFLYPPLTVLTFRGVTREKGIRTIEVKPQIV